jgi:hypothetical protein
VINEETRSTGLDDSSLEGTQNHSALCPVGARVTGVEKPDLCNRIIIGFLTEPADEAAGGR